MNEYRKYITTTKLSLFLLFILNKFQIVRKRKIKKKIKTALNDINSIPIFLISFNRLSYVSETIKWLEKYGFNRIYIIDNGSTYPPLLNYYKTIKYKVFYIGQNLGHMVFWEDERFKIYRDNFYVVTDPDLVPVDDCPKDFLERFLEALKKYPFVKKIGFSLKIDDLPNDSLMAQQAKEWEKRFYQVPIKKDGVYYGQIDTTFALYVPDDCVMCNHLFLKILRISPFLTAFRTAAPYQVRHLPWYKKNDDVTDEDRFYSTYKTNGWWNPVIGNMSPD